MIDFKNKQLQNKLITRECGILLNKILCKKEDLSWKKSKAQEGCSFFYTLLGEIFDSFKGTCRKSGC